MRVRRGGAAAREPLGESEKTLRLEVSKRINESFPSSNPTEEILRQETGGGGRKVCPQLVDASVNYTVITRRKRRSGHNRK